jgi:hypothetical protein
MLSNSTCAVTSSARQRTASPPTVGPGTQLTIARHLIPRALNPRVSMATCEYDVASIVLPGPTGRAAGPGRRGCWRRAAGRLGVRAGGVRAPPLAGCVRAPPLAGCVGAPPLAGCWDNLAAVGVGAALLGRARPCFGRVRPPPLVCVNIVCLNIRIATSSRKKLMKLILGLFRSSLTARLYPVSTAPRGVPPPAHPKHSTRAHSS